MTVEAEVNLARLDLQVPKHRIDGKRAGTNRRLATYDRGGGVDHRLEAVCRDQFTLY